jgi:cytochrome c biogenesis protein CcdA
MLDFTIGKITLLALADSVNPCAIAVLVMILVAILTQNPDKKKQVLFGGLAFVAAVFIGYLTYGLVITQFFRVLGEFLRNSAIYVTKGMAILAMLLGALNIKDFFFYKKGSFATEMPLFMRPKVKRITEKATSTLGAFLIGFVVTLFLLPCTSGPLFVASEILSKIGFLASIPWLLYYTFIFVLPMLIIVLLIFLGIFVIGEVADWKERNIKRLHLIAGILLFLVGLSILFGWI